MINSKTLFIKLVNKEGDYKFVLQKWQGCITGGASKRITEAYSGRDNIYTKNRRKETVGTKQWSEKVYCREKYGNIFIIQGWY